MWQHIIHEQESEVKVKTIRVSSATKKKKKILLKEKGTIIKDQTYLEKYQLGFREEK